MNIRKDMHFAIVFTGAPYGDNEGGHIVSCHKTYDNAEKAFGKAFTDSTGNWTTGVLNNYIVCLDKTYGRIGRDQTAREYFSS